MRGKEKKESRGRAKTAIRYRKEYAWMYESMVIVMIQYFRGGRQIKDTAMDGKNGDQTKEKKSQ